MTITILRQAARYTGVVIASLLMAALLVMLGEMAGLNVVARAW